MKKAVPCFGAVAVSMPLEFNAKAQRGKGAAEPRAKNARSLQTIWTTAVQRSRGAKWKTDFSSDETNHRLVNVRNCALAVKFLASLRLCTAIVQIVCKPRGFLARAWSRSVWSARSLLPLSMTLDIRQREQAPRSPYASRGSVAALPHCAFALKFLMNYYG